MILHVYEYGMSSIIKLNMSYMSVPLERYLYIYELLRAYLSSSLFNLVSSYLQSIENLLPDYYILYVLSQG